MTKSINCLVCGASDSFVEMLKASRRINIFPGGEIFASKLDDTSETESVYCSDCGAEYKDAEAVIVAAQKAAQ